MLRRFCLAATVFACTATSALAQPSYSGVFFFGTSELDTGNWLLNSSLSSHVLAPTAAKGYYNGRWQSGLSFSDYFAQALGFTATPSLAGGRNYAYGVGWLGPLPGEALPTPGTLAANTALYFGSQVNAALADHGGALPSSALYVVSIGSNDMDFFGRPIGLADDVANLAVSKIQLLAAAGARNFMVQTLGGPVTNSFAATYNQTLLAGLAGITGINLTVIDTRTFNQTVVLAPGFLSSLGILDFNSCLADAPCQAAAIAQTTNGQPYSGSSHYLFDNIHRDTKVLEAFAQYAIAQLPATTTVPEPGTIVLMAFGLAGAGLWRSKRR